VQAGKWRMRGLANCYKTVKIPVTVSSLPQPHVDTLFLPKTPLRRCPSGTRPQRASVETAGDRPGTHRDRYTTRGGTILANVPKIAATGTGHENVREYVWILHAFLVDSCLDRIRLWLGGLTWIA